ncbi:MAG: hypothetical protein ACYC9Y_03270 [Candidatus Methylomirabilia bacterium]
MMSSLTDRRFATFAGVALLVSAVLASACGRPPDEAWLRCTGFSNADETTPLAVIEGKLDSTTLKANANFENRSLNVTNTGGTGILVYRARIDYRMAGYSPPSAEYDFTLYLPPPAKSEATIGTLTAFPLASASLKQWLINAGVSTPVELTARVTFFGETDEGGKIETVGSIGISLTNTK